jgi:outer membrane protein assembly factor BamB
MVYAINGKSGEKKWVFRTGGRVYSSPAIGSDGTVYIGSMDGKVFALDGKTGAKIWEFYISVNGFVHSSPAIGPDGTVYVLGNNGRLYAIKTDSKGPAKSPWPMFGQNAQRTGRKVD